MAARRLGPSLLAFLLVSLPLCSVPVFAQVVVNSLSVSFNDESDQFVEASSNHRFDFDVTINLGTGDNANEDGNLARWSLTLEVLNDGNRCATPTVTLNPAQAGVAISANGQGVMPSVTFTADLSSCLCTANTVLRVELASPSYTLGGNTDTSPSLNCLGVIGSSLSLVTSAGLVENGESQTVFLQIIANSESQGRSVSCSQNCWSVSVYVASGTLENPVEIADTKVTAILPSGTGSSSWAAGSLLTLSGVTATLDLSNKGSCEDLDLVCTELTRNPASIPDFTIDGTTIVSCAPVTCLGVVINHVLLSYTSLAAIKQGEDNTGIGLTATITADNSKASITGSDLWAANVFGNAKSDCSDATQVPGTVTLTQASSYGLDANSQSIWPQIEVSLNLAQHSCSDARYICVEVLKGNNPTPDFTLSFSPESAKYGIIQVSCTGLTVASGTLTVNGATQLAAFKEAHQVQFMVSFTSAPTSGGVGGSQLWELIAFPAFESDGTGQKGPETTVPLDNSQLSTGFPGAGETMTLSSLTATLSLTNDACGTYRYLCVQLRKNSMASPDFVIQTSPIVCSDMLDCRDVKLISTAVSASGGQSPNGLPLYEGVADQDIYFDVSIQSDGTAGSVPSGTDHWEFVVDPGQVSADLTQDQKDKTLTAGQELTFSRVKATLDLTNTHCADLGDVCAEIRRSADDSLNFVLASGSAENMGCFTPTCGGVEITSLFIQDGVTNFDLKEGTQDHTLTFSVDVTTNADKGSVRGTGLWKLLVFLSSDSTNPNQVEALAETGVWMNQDVLAGVDTTLSNVQVELDLDTTCANMRFLCVQLTKADGQTFLLDQSPETLQTCKPVPQCNGIEVDSVSVGFQNGQKLVEGVTDNNPVVDISLTFTDTSASADGTNIWSVTVWGSPDAGGATRYGTQTSTISGDPLASQTVALTGLIWSVDMSSRLCVDFDYVCAEVELADGVDHTLSPETKMRCEPAVCEGVVITSEQFTFTASDIYEASTPQELTTSTIHAEATNNGASIEDDEGRFWEVELFLNSAADGSGQTFGTATAVGLTPAQERQGVSSTDPLTFDTELVFTFNVEVMCGDALYVCLEIRKREGSPDNDVTFPALPVCQEINCIGVVFTAASLTAQDNLVVTENEARQSVRLSYQANLASKTATLETGSDFWQLSVFASSQADGSGTRHGTALATLSSNQATARAVADGTVEMTDVAATLDLDNFVCPGNTVYLCAELQRHPDSDPPFTIQGTPDPLVACQEVECQGVLITGISINGLPDALVEKQVNPLSLDVVAGIGGADASGTNLWRMIASLVDGNGDVLESQDVDLGSQASADVTSGSTVTFSNLAVPLDLRDLVCPSSGSVQLCIELLRGGSADANFTVTGMTQNCTDVDCLGVVINRSEVTTSSGSLKEGEFENPITLSVSYWSSSDGASIIGTGLWSVKVFGNDRESGLGTRVSEKTGTLQGNDADFPLAKGGTVDFNEVMATLSLFPNGVCEDVHWVCAELVKGDSASPDFSLTDENNALIACTNMDCVGVQILSTTLVIDDNVVVEDSGEQVIELTKINMMAGPDSSSLINDDQRNFKVVVFGNSQEDISGPSVAETEMTFESIGFQVHPGEVTALSGRATLNLTDVFCEDLQYICVRIYRGEEVPRKYKLEGIPDGNSLIDCAKVSCRGVRVTEASLDTTSTLLEGKQSYSVEVTATFDTDASGASVRPGGTDIFKMMAFLSGTADGGEPKTEEQEVNLPQGSEKQPVMAGNAISFTAAQAQLDTTDWTCQAQNFLCVRLLRDPLASADYLLEGWDTNSQSVDNSLLQVCTAINCRGVEITDVLFYDAGELYFKERDAESTLSVDLGLVSDPLAGGVDGEGLWQLTASLNSAADGSGDDFGTVKVLELSEANSGVGVDPTGPPANLTSVVVSLPGVADLRCDQAAEFYLCIQLEKGPNSDPDFTLKALEPSCTIIQCHPVKINELILEVTTPAFIRENQENALHVDLTVHMDEMSASISGAGLWATPTFEMRDAGGTKILDATGSYWGLVEQNKALNTGEIEKFENIFPVTVTPTNHLCSQLKQLCMTLAKGPNPNPDFTLEFAQGAEVCVDVECRGVEIISTVITDIAAGDTVTERSVTPQTITVSVSASSQAEGSSVSGTNLWTLTVYYTPNADGSVDPVLGSTTASLTAAQGNTDLTAGDDLLLEGVQTTNVDVSGLVCPEGELYLCVQLERGANSDPIFTLTGQNDDSLVGCKIITCIGVEVEETSLLLQTGMLIPVEKAQSHPVDFGFLAITSDRTALLDGSDLWRLQLFANRRADGTNYRRLYEEDVALTQLQRDQDVLNEGDTISFLTRSVDINLQATDVECRDIDYLCGEILKGPSPTPEFSLQGNPTDNELIDCIPIDCNGVKIASFELTNTGGSILRENQASQPFSFDVSLTSAADKESVSGDNLWKFEVFLNDAADCLGDARVGGLARGQVALTDANVRPGQEDLDLTAGGTLDFDVDVSMDYLNKCPDWDQVFICLEVVIGDTSSTAFTLFGDVLKGAEIVCRGVEVTGTDVYSVNEGDEFVESDPDVTFDLTLRSTTVAEASSIAGTGLWAVDIYLSAEEDCAVASTERVAATLTPANRDRAVTAGGVLSLSGVRATIALDGALCDSLAFVCAVLSQGDSPVPDFTLVPKPDESALLASQAVECKGLHILSSSLTMQEGEPMISGNPQHPVGFLFALFTDPDAASIPNPTDLFRLHVAATDTPDAAGVVASGHHVTLPFSPAAGVDVDAGQPIYLTVDAVLDLSGARCEEVPYLCATLMKGLNPMPPYTLTPDGDSPVLTACSERLDCYGVRIAAESLSIDSGIPFKEYASSNPVELTVTLVADEVSGNAVGNDLWSAEVKLSLDDPLAADTQFLAATQASFVGGDEGASLMRDSSVQLSMTASLDLTGISCADAHYLVVNITNSQADPEFSLEWRAGGPEYVIVSKSFTCEGVSFIRGQLDVDFDPQPLKELASTQDVTFTVSVGVTADSAMVTGEDLWKVTAFVSSQADGMDTPEDEKSEADLTNDQGSVSITASAISSLSDVEVTLNTEGKYCSDMTFLCVEVWRGDSAQPYYNIESPAEQADLRICRPTLCNGVKIASVELSLSAEVPLIEMRPNQAVSVNAEITATPDSAGIEGDNLWAATVFVNSEADGSGDRRSERQAVIDPAQSSKDLDPDAGTLSLEDLVATMDFTGIPCSEMTYLCVTLEEGDQAMPDFNLETSESLTKCIETNCISVAIGSNSLSLESNEVLERDDQASFRMSATFDPWPNSRSLQEANSWQLFAFTTDDSGAALTLAQVDLSQEQQDQAVTVGTPLEFNDREVTLDVSGQTCATTTRFCLLLGTQDGVSFTLGGYPTRDSLIACADLICSPMEVEIFATDVTENRIEVGFSEALGDFAEYRIEYSPLDGITTSPYLIPRNLERKHSFDQLVPGKEYTIQLDLVKGTMEKAGPFTLVQRTLPDPVDVTLVSITPSEMTISWDEAEGIFDHYVVELNPQDSALPRSPYLVFPNNEREVTFTNLLLARQYTVTVSTVSGDLSSRPGSIITNTAPATPDLQLPVTGETSVDLIWFVNGDQYVDVYEVRYQPAGVDAQPLLFPRGSSGTTLEGLTPGRRYEISLVAVSNTDGLQEIRSMADSEVTQTLPVPPELITLTPTETDLVVTWESAQGDKSHYTVSLSPSATLDEVTVDRDERMVRFQNLQVANEYTVTIRTYVNSASGMLESRPAQRTIYTLPNPPRAISIVEVTTGSIEIQWEDAVGPRDGYEVTFDPSEDEFNHPSPTFTTSNSFLLSGIKPHVTVDFEVRTKIGDTLSRPATRRQRTFPTLPGKVRDFQIEGFDTDNILISFMVPEDPNGLIVAYVVTVDGSKPGHPSEEVFQTITALPNDVRFEEVISPLKAGFTYTLSIQATNTEGLGEPVSLDPVTLPIRAPQYTNGLVPILSVTATTIRVRLPRSTFSDRNGAVILYTILVVENGANQTAGAILPSYQVVGNTSPKPVYQSLEPFNPFIAAENRQGRRRRQAEETVDIIVGEETTCPSTGYCNGALTPVTQYRISVRAFTENGLHTDTPWSEIITTKFDPWWFVYAFIPFIIVILIIAFIMCLCTCIASERRKPKNRMYKGREKEVIVVNQENVNASNNVQMASLSQVPDTPPTPRPKPTPTSRPVAVAKFSQHVRKMSTKTGETFAKEYQDLNLIGEKEAKTIGALPQNEEKNRYGNIIPYDYNRVRLNKDDDYINASLLSGFNGDGEYIAAQGPQANSVNDFWQMVWEQNVPVIAAVGSCVEKSRVKFAQYWPSDSNPITFGEVTVSKVSESEETAMGYIVRDFCLESGSEMRAVRQYQFTAWPHHGVPKKTDQMLHFVRSVRAYLPPNAGPLLVHCGAGIGRTGVFVVLDILTQQVVMEEEFVDVYGIVVTKREERTNMVQTELQYEFVHRALLDILEGRVTDPNWTLKSKRRSSIDSDQRVQNAITEAAL